MAKHKSTSKQHKSVKNKKFTIKGKVTRDSLGRYRVGGKFVNAEQAKAVKTLKKIKSKRTFKKPVVVRKRQPKLKYRPKVEPLLKPKKRLTKSADLTLSTKNLKRSGVEEFPEKITKLFKYQVQEYRIPFNDPDLINMIVKRVKKHKAKGRKFLLTSYIKGKLQDGSLTEMSTTFSRGIDDRYVREMSDELYLKETAYAVATVHEYILKIHYLKD
jgi:hypothetical protein